MVVICQIAVPPADGHAMEMSTRSSRRWIRKLGHLGRESRDFAVALGASPARSRRLLVVGHPGFEPWHFTAHLADQAGRVGRLDLRPTLLRWAVPDGAPAHLAHPVSDLAEAAGHHTVLVINPLRVDDHLLERVADARRHGARVMSVHKGDRELLGLSHETIDVDPGRPVVDFELAQHIVSELGPTPA